MSWAHGWLDYFQFSDIRLDTVVIETGIGTVFGVKLINGAQEQVMQPRTVGFFQLLTYRKKYLVMVAEKKRDI